MPQKSNKSALVKIPKLKFRFLIPENSYIVIHEVYERFGGSEPRNLVGTGEAVHELLKKVFDYKAFLEEDGLKDNQKNLQKFLKYCEDLNGDGFDYIQVFKLPTNN
jgi:ATP-dependent exoDNAse (exonuclease V) beta subunit